MAHAQSQPQQEKPADLMRELRLRLLTDPPSTFGIKSSREFPRVYGILMDWPIGENTASVVSLCTGDASLYTTATFGIIGGVGHKAVREASTKFVKAAESFYNDSVATSDFSYPAADRVRFYLVTFHGVRVIETELASVTRGRSKLSSLFGAGQLVLTQLRAMAERKP